MRDMRKRPPPMRIPFVHDSLTHLGSHGFPSRCRADRCRTRAPECPPVVSRPTGICRSSTSSGSSGVTRTSGKTSPADGQHECRPPPRSRVLVGRLCRMRFPQRREGSPPGCDLTTTAFTDSGVSRATLADVRSVAARPARPQPLGRRFNPDRRLRSGVAARPAGVGARPSPPSTCPPGSPQPQCRRTRPFPRRPPPTWS
jgi:hypothetical protein